MSLVWISNMIVLHFEKAMSLKVFNPNSSLWEGGGWYVSPSLNFKYNHSAFWEVGHVAKGFNPSSLLCHLSSFHLVLCHCFKAKDWIKLKYKLSHVCHVPNTNLFADLKVHDSSFFFLFWVFARFPFVEKVSVETPRIKKICLGSKIRDGTVVRALALPPIWPWFKSWSWRHMWVEFVVDSLPCSERFFSGYSGFPLSSNTSKELPTHGDVSTSS